MAFIIDIKVKTRIPGKSWDVTGKYLNDDPILLGTVIYNDRDPRDDRWVPYAINGNHPLTWCPTKTKAVKFCATELLEHFSEVECRWGKQVWNLKKIGI